MIQRLLSAARPMLLALAFAAATTLPAAAHASDGLAEGRDYIAIAGGQPFRANPGRIEVVEVFAYWCHHCSNFQSSLATWARRQPADVAFRYLPAAFTLDDVAARAYFAADALGALDRTHEATYRAIHAEQSLPARGGSMDEYATLYAGFGVDRAALLAAMRSPETDARMAASRDFMVATGVQGTPTIIVNGRYRVLGRSFADILRITDLLLVRERAALKGP